MFCISVSFKKTPLSIRQKFAFSAEEQKRFLSGLWNAGKITGGVVVSTCNRSEIYVTGEKAAFEAVENALVLQKGIEKESIKTYCLYYTGKKAVRHLFRVACGLDSMVLGEDEIFRQVKEAYQTSYENGFVNGELNIIFQGAFHCAKQSKSATRLSTTPVSIGTLAANTVEAYLEEKKRIERGVISRNRLENGIESKTSETNEDLGPKGTVLVIGATGKIGSIVAKDLMAKGISVIGTQRRRHQGEEIFLSSHEKISFVDFHKRYDFISEVDAIVSATSSPHYTLTEGEYDRRREKKGHLLIDLAVPFDIDKEIGRLSDVVLYDIDYFESLSKENSNIKFGELKKAERLLEERVEEVMKNLYVREFNIHMAGKKQEEWYPKMVYHLKEVLDSDELLRVLKKLEQ